MPFCLGVKFIPMYGAPGSLFGLRWHQIQFTEQLHASLPGVHTLLFCEAERRGPLLIGVIKAPFEAFKSPRNSKPDYWGGKIGTRRAKLDMWASCVFFSSCGVSLGVHLRILLCHSCVKFPSHFKHRAPFVFLALPA